MEVVNVPLLVAALALMAGLAGGALLYHLILCSRTSHGKMKSQIDHLEAELTSYQDKVSDHFNTTAHLINKLTDSYKDVYEHMASSANELCNDDEIKNRLSDSLISSSAMLSGEINKRRTERITPLEQPRDYADKKSPNEKGVLSEDYSLTNGSTNTEN